MSTAVYLVPVDGSASSGHAVRYVIDAVKAGQRADIHLLNVQPLISGQVARAVGSEAVHDYQRSEAEVALAPAKAALDAAGIAYKAHIGVGDAGDVVADFAESLKCSQIVMGSRGLGSALGLLLGSVATHVLKHVDVPVTLVK